MSPDDLLCIIPEAFLFGMIRVMEWVRRAGPYIWIILEQAAQII